MGKIIGSLVMQFVGAMLLVGAVGTKGDAAIPLYLIGAGLSIGGLVLLLSGLRDYFLGGIMGELRKIVKNTSPEEPKP